MNSFKGLSGDDLENWFKHLFKEELKFVNYITSSGQISLDTIDPSQSPGEHLEIDGALLIHKTCVFFEYTDQATNPKDKIKKFIRNLRIFKQSPKSLMEKFKIFGMPNALAEDFSEAINWKYVFIGTSQIYDEKDYTRKDFPDDSEIQKRLFILNPSDINYLSGLIDDIGYYAKNEFLYSLGFDAKDLGIEESIDLSYLEISNKFLSNSVQCKANIYLTGMKIDSLLNIAKVSRFEGITIEDSDETSYQRLFKKDKLKAISKNFIEDNKRRMFPNTITVVLANGCKIENNKLIIPKRYGALEVIDGQHRLFSYAQDSVPTEVRENAEIAVSAIMFQDASDSDIEKYAGSIFCEINSNQDKVTNNFIYRLKYDQLGHRDHISIACKLLIYCSSKRGALEGLFTTEKNIKINKFGLPPLPLPTVVDGDLEPFLKGLNTSGKPVDDALYKQVFGIEKSEADNNPDLLLNSSKVIIDQYFSNIQSVFDKDWVKNSNSEIFKAKFISGFIKFLRYLMFEEQKSLADLRTSLEILKNKIVAKNGDNLIFDGTSQNGIPTVKDSARDIFNSLKGIYQEP